jgi:hypothetical protein
LVSLVLLSLLLTSLLPSLLLSLLVSLVLFKVDMSDKPTKATRAAQNPASELEQSEADGSEDSDDLPLTTARTKPVQAQAKRARVADAKVTSKAKRVRGKAKVHASDGESSGVDDELPRASNVEKVLAKGKQLPAVPATKRPAPRKRVQRAKKAKVHVSDGESSTDDDLPLAVACTEKQRTRGASRRKARGRGD